MDNPRILIASDEEKDKQIAKLKATFEEKEKEAKKAQEEKEELEAKLKATLEEDKMEGAKKALLKAIEEETDEDKKTAKKAVLKAMEDMDKKKEGSVKGTEDEEKKEMSAVIASLTAKAAKPTIDKIVEAKRLAGATEEVLKSEVARLTAMTLPQVEAEYNSNEVYIKALSARVIPQSTDISFEGNMPFNGETPRAMTGNTIDLDEALEKVVL